ncbi:MAG TPA: hypothetical protein VFT43_15735 [Candidatus Polarisedimenticolia bacterium]|nr:hypothetical protein [Candidatus Polarisedimenticolia bacterium]
MRILRPVMGAALAGLGLLVLWSLNLVAPPEGLSRRVAAFVAVYPGPWRESEVERIPCSPLREARLYVVCTQGCEDVWRIVAVRGLIVWPIANLGRLPPEAPDEGRRRFNEMIGRERMRLDPVQARDLLGCYLRLDGLYPELVVLESDLETIEGARGDDEATNRIMAGLEEAVGLSNIEVREAGRGFAARLLYWDVMAAGRPVLEMEFSLDRGGAVRAVRVREHPAPGGTASGSTPGTPPT